MEKSSIITAIVNRGEAFSTLDGVITPTSTVHRTIISHLKAGKAHKVVDNATTLAYHLSPLNS